MTDIILVPSDILEGDPMRKIDTWSYSRLNVFEQCKLRAKLAYIDRIPELERPLPPGKTEHANDRGTRIHKAAELFVQGGIELIPELRVFREEFLRLRELYKQGKVSLEQALINADSANNLRLKIKLEGLKGDDAVNVLLDRQTGGGTGDAFRIQGGRTDRITPLRKR